jgi:sphingosine kinase
VINPVGGTGRGKEIYQEQVASIFQQSNIECEEMVTQRQAHATEIMTQIPLNHYDCIVSVGGDGLLSESK